MNGFFAELKRRNVLRVGAAYAVVAWVMVQIGEAVFPAFGVPDGIFRGMVILLVLGFPAALVLAWVYELTPEGIKLERDVDRSQSITSETGRKLDRAIIAILLLAVVILLADKFVVSEFDEGAGAGGSEVADAGSVNAKSVAVLPFVDMSPYGDQEYLADGLADALLHGLTQCSGLKVSARTSSFAFKGQNQDIRSIGEQLGVATILEGSVQKAGNRLRIITQLIDVSDGSHLWSATFDRTDEDVFAIQDEISAAVVDALEVTLLEGEAERLTTRATNDVKAFDLYLLGRHEFHKRTRQSLRDAIGYFEQAVAIDENFAPAYTGLADGWMFLSEVNYGELSIEEAGGRAKPYVERALELAPESSQSQATLGQYLHEFRREGEFPGQDSISALEHAIELNPGNSLAHLWLSIDYQGVGRYRDSMEHLEIAYALDPLNTNLIMNMGWWSLMRGRDDEVRRYNQQLIRRYGDEARIHGWISGVEALGGRADLGLKHALEAVRIEPDNIRYVTDVLYSCRLLRVAECEDKWRGRALELAPDSNPVLAELTAIHQRHGELAEAAAVGERRLDTTLGVDQNWSNVMARFAAADLAAVYTQQGRYAEAAALFERVFPDLTDTLGRNDHFNAGRLAQLAWAYRNLERTEREQAALAEAIRRIERARSQGITHWSLDFDQAQILAQQGDSAGAENLLEAAIAGGFLGGEPEAMDRLGRLLDHSPRFREALALLEETLAGQSEAAAQFQM